MFGKAISILQYVFEGTTMSYNSLIFFSCLLFFLLIYFLMRRNTVKIVWIFVANMVFYVWSCGKAGAIIILGTAVVVYLMTRWMEHIYNRYDAAKEGLSPKEATTLFTKYKKNARKILLLGLVLIIAVWVYVKVGKFLDFDSVETFRELFASKSVIVPLGISYYSMSAIGYMLDVFWRKTKPEHNVLGLFTVMTYFPHIVQGPISKYSNLLKQIKELPAFDYERVCYGLQLMLWGYIKKIVIADRLVLYTSTIFANPASYAGTEIFVAVVMCIFQLYADFSGCVDIARGISQAIGIDLANNFRQPFCAKGARDFWRRWHITLGAWTKDYIYIPIAVNPRFMKIMWNMKKKGRGRLSTFLKAFMPLVAVWLYTGIWHGTGLDYVVWGLYWCGLMILSDYTKDFSDKVKARMGIDTEKRWYQMWINVRSCIMFAVGRMFTVVGGLAGCGLLWRQLFAQARFWTLFDGSLYTHGLDQKDFYIALIGMILMMFVDARHEHGHEIRKTIAAQPIVLRWIVYLGAMMAIVVFGIYGSGYDPASFVYGGF